MSTKKYSLSFTTGTLFHYESIELARLFIQTNDWKTTRNMAVDDNLLQARTLNSLQRVCHEVLSRLKTLHIQELTYLVEATPRQQNYLLWLGICRRYQFIADFAVEVLHEHYVTLKNVVTHDDFNIFYNRKSDWHNELNTIALSTRAKLRQVLFKMLREAELINDDDLILPALLSPELIALIARHNPQDFLRLPIFEQDIRRASS